MLQNAISTALTLAKARAKGGMAQYGTKTLLKVKNAPIAPNAPRLPGVDGRQKVHVGPIHSFVAGRTDHLPVHVRSGSYVIPADIVSGVGEGNTSAGFKVAKSIFTAPSRTKGAPYGISGSPYGAAMPGKAEGGSVDDDDDNAPLVPVVVAGGEYILGPKDVRHHGKGSLEDGHKVLDEFVKRYRKKLVKTLSKLPGPRTD